jgi:hypothetical protein
VASSFFLFCNPSLRLKTEKNIREYEKLLQIKITVRQHYKIPAPKGVLISKEDFEIGTMFHGEANNNIATLLTDPRVRKKYVEDTTK